MQELILEEMDEEDTTFEESIINDLLEYESIAEYLEFEDLEKMTD